MGKSGMGNVIVTVSGKIPLPGTAKPLGKTRSQAWAAWPLDQAVSAPCDSALRLAYLDEAEFRQENQGLRPAQVAEAMHKRSTENGQYLADMSDRLATETGRMGAWINDSAALEVHWEGYFTGRFIYENIQDIEELIRERDRIGALEKELLARKDCPPALAESLRQRDTAIALAHLEKAAGLLHPSKAIQPDANLKRQDAAPRIVYARVIPPGLASKVENHDFVVDKAGKGYLIPQTPEEIAKLPPSMHPVIAFLDAAESARAVRLLTPAQLEKRLAILVAQDGPSRQDYLSEILDAHLRMLATLRQCLASAKPQLTQTVRAEMEAAYTQILAEARQSAIDLLGPVDPAAGQARLAELRLRIRILGRFSAASGDAGLIAWAQRSAIALEKKP
jgi:hypothetical protein